MIVNTSIPYNSHILKKNIDSLISNYPFLEQRVIGYSVIGTPIYSLILGSGSKRVLYVASTHANEWITTPLLMKFIEDFSFSYSNNSNINSYNIQDIFNKVSLHVVPMLNPDGVDLVTSKLNTNNAYYMHAKAIADNYSTIPFPDGWKANIRGVDFKNYQLILFIIQISSFIRL